MAAGIARRTGPLLVACVTLVLPLAVITSTAPPVPAPIPVTVASPQEAPPPLLEPDELPPEIASPPPMPAESPSPNPFPRWTREDNLNFLLVGIDRRAANEIYRTDTIILGNLDVRSRRGTLISIPRDLIVTIPGFAQDRINAAYSIGESQKRPGGGLALLRNTVEQNFGVKVHHHAAVDFNCFRGTVNALGGVALTIPQRIYDPRYPTDDYGYKVVTFEAGYQRLDGERALEYVRTRYGDSDFGRMRRQQQLVSALNQQALQVKNLTALPQIANACSGMSSDLSMFELAALGAVARDIRPADVALKVIDERLAVPYTARSGASVLMPRWELIRALVRGSMPTTTASVSAG